MLPTTTLGFSMRRSSAPQAVLNRQRMCGVQRWSRHRHAQRTSWAWRSGMSLAAPHRPVWVRRVRGRHPQQGHEPRGRRHRPALSHCGCALQYDAHPVEDHCDRTPRERGQCLMRSRMGHTHIIAAPLQGPHRAPGGYGWRPALRARRAVTTSASGWVGVNPRWRRSGSRYEDRRRVVRGCWRGIAHSYSCPVV
jgi:hypothetical protein